MSHHNHQQNHAPATETVAEVVRLPNGGFVIRPKHGHSLSFGKLAKFKPLVNGSVELEFLTEWIETDEAMEILGVPYTTLRRILELQAVICYKRSEKRWLISLTSVLDLKRRALEDPEFWDILKSGSDKKPSRQGGFRTVATSLQTGLKLS